MSWSMTVPPVSKAEFPSAVDAARPEGQNLQLPGMAEDVQAVRSALKALALRVKRPRVRGSGGGHCLQPEEGSNWSDGLTANVSGEE